MVGAVPIYFGSAFVLLCLLAFPFHVALLVLFASLAPLLLFGSASGIAWFAVFCGGCATPLSSTFLNRSFTVLAANRFASGLYGCIF